MVAAVNVKKVKRAIKVKEGKGEIKVQEDFQEIAVKEVLKDFQEIVEQKAKREIVGSLVELVHVVKRDREVCKEFKANVDCKD